MQSHKNLYNPPTQVKHNKRKSVFFFQDRPLQLTSPLLEAKQTQTINQPIQFNQSNQTQQINQTNDNLITHMPFRNTQSILTTSKNNNKELMICNHRPQIIQTNSNPFFANNNYMNDVLAMPQMIAEFKKQ